MDRPTLEMADVFRRYGDTYRDQARSLLSTAQRRVMTAIEQCRTAALGGHVEQCDRCGHRRVWYNSCRNRHCPSCQAMARAAWIEDRKAELLDTEYFHVVFTVPDEIAVIASQNKAVVYGILFRTAAETLRTIAADPKHLGAEKLASLPCCTPGDKRWSTIHTCTASSQAAASRSIKTRWISCRPGFFLPVRVLSRLFRRLFLEELQDAFDAGQLQFSASLHALSDREGFAEHLEPVRRAEWVVYARRPFAGPEQVLDYVGR
jgi:transposase-like zinc-binding protein/putative transposase